MDHKLLLPLILLFSTFSSSAEERWFEVELLLFQRNVDIADVKEDLSSENIAIDTANSLPFLKTAENLNCIAGEPCMHEPNPVLIDKASFDTDGNVFQLLDNSQLQFAAQREKLANHAAFTPLLHLAWRMPVESKNNAKPIHIFAGKNFALTMLNQALNNTQKGLLSDEGMSEKLESVSNQDLVSDIINAQSSPSADKWAIDGNLKIYLNHYLFIDSQLLIRQQVTQAVKSREITPQPDIEIINTENDVQVIKLTAAQESIEVENEIVLKEVLFDQNRRLRSEEIHYFDHPLMGMIIQIRKIAPEQSVQ
ncbi:peptidoglycan binding protein CsiV [Psychromonas antarctica]|uniref:peptidoglycan binding protein CsiV n=1 Tax=Psychromonas antarctica TaxID=67573 RepID=UPI001EE903D6|nr:peptidoglycan binding protein CsiV [Psychromonas antarctica]MCG6200485.1 peptidoglycan binding protein CsiV [Psychromonas antarctica]